jgi:hypothetical protein
MVVVLPAVRAQVSQNLARADGETDIIDDRESREFFADPLKLDHVFKVIGKLYTSPSSFSNSNWGHNTNFRISGFSREKNWPDF